MSTAPIEVNGIVYRPESALRRGLRALRGHAAATAAVALGKAAKVALGVARGKAAPAARHVQENGYSIIGFGVFDSAMFVHSVFTGLLVTGISFLVFEWKVQEGPRVSA
jgi:hypothetical protein